MAQKAQPAEKLRALLEAVEKENRLKLNWFKKNEERLLQISNYQKKGKITKEEIAKVEEGKIKAFRSATRANVPVVDTPPPSDYKTVQNLMRPVDPNHKKLIYTARNKDGRINYLKQRQKIPPEERYFFPETTNFEYGWNMSNIRKSGMSFGRQQVINHSFYRTSGVNRDPDWYISPSKHIPLVCGSI